MLWSSHGQLANVRIRRRSVASAARSGQLVGSSRSSATPRPSRVVGVGCYTVPWSDGSLLVGATVEEAGFDESDCGRRANVGGRRRAHASGTHGTVRVRPARPSSATPDGLRDRPFRSSPASSPHRPLATASSSRRTAEYRRDPSRGRELPIRVFGVTAPTDSLSQIRRHEGNEAHEEGFPFIPLHVHSGQAKI